MSTEWSTVNDRLAQLEANAETQAAALDAAFLLTCAVFAFMMQFGFAALEVGSVRPKNTKSVLLKNIMDAAIGALTWWLVGHGVAFGETGGSFTNKFIGEGALAFSPKLSEDNMSGVALKYASWMLQWAFTSTSTTIVSGAIAERITLHAYLIHTVVMTSLVYPVAAHWAWSDDGWASAYLPDDADFLVGCGVTDFSGSGVVHVTGGLTALIAAVLTRARGGRFDSDGNACRLPKQSPVLNVLGALTLWTGWFFFNASSVRSFSEHADSAAKSLLNTAISPSASVSTSILLHWMYHRRFDSFMATNSLLGGLVAITASSPLVETEAAFVIGVMGGVLYFYGSRWLLRFQVDDVVDASVVHGLCGLWGMIATGLFSTREGYARAYSQERAADCCGLFYGCGGNILGANLLFCLALVAWVGGCGLILFGAINHTLGLRIDDTMEEEGMDKTRHGNFSNTLSSGTLGVVGAVRRLSVTNRSTSRAATQHAAQEHSVLA